MTQKELAEKLGKRPSEISKWLTGNHNFTHDTLFDIQTILNIRLLDAEMESVNEFIRIEPVRMEYKDKKSFVFPVSMKTFYSYNEAADWLMESQGMKDAKKEIIIARIKKAIEYNKMYCGRKWRLS